MLVDYKYYIEDFGGEKISTESAFKKTRDLADVYMDDFTSGRAESDTENEHRIKSCLCEMCDVIYNLTVNDGKIVKSENTDGYSASYVTECVDGQDANKVLESKLYRIAKTYLGNTGLLYRGIC